MLIIIVLVFLAAFVVVALLMIAAGPGKAEQGKKVMARLDSALAVGKPDNSDLLVDVRKNELMSSIPWLDRTLAQLELAPRLRRLLYQADLKWTVGGLLLFCFGCFFVAGWLVYYRTNAILFGLLIGLVAAAAPLIYVVFKRNKRLSKFEQGLPEAIDLIVNALRVGHSLNAATGLVSRECPDPVGTEFRTCFDEQNYGLELKVAMENMIARMPVQDLKIVATAILIQRESGGNLAEVLEKTSSVIRERFRLKRQVLTHTAQGRLTGVILTLLPIVLGCLLYTINPTMMRILWTTPIGIKLMYAAGIMIIIGGLIIRKIVNLDV
ncbi:MAG TPA: type II secretion system F family protein [Terracidiphilus sp.]|jgi:tight adherence protein B|nr:type II secretion system F family protein [Terracidiphilus sp.]